MSTGVSFANMYDTLLATFGSSATVTRKGGETFTIRAAKGNRRRTDDMTGGMSQQEKTLSVDKAEWDSKTSKPPQRTDVFEIAGVRYAVIDNDIKGVDDVFSIYKMTIKG